MAKNGENHTIILVGLIERAGQMDHVHGARETESTSTRDGRNLSKVMKYRLTVYRSCFRM